MGNVCLTKHIRAAIANQTEISFSEAAHQWFKIALGAEDHSRWARFGICQVLVVAGRPLDEEAQSDVRKVIASVNREYQNRVEERSKVLSKITEYICMLMLEPYVKDDDRNAHERRLISIANTVESRTSDVTARTIYSQLRKQNVDKDVFIAEFSLLTTNRDLRAAYRAANTPAAQVP